MKRRPKIGIRTTMTLVATGVVLATGACSSSIPEPTAPRVAFRAWDAPGTDALPGERVVALTFDDGPDPRWTPEVLAVLARYGVPATFFNVGYEVNARPDLIRAQVDGGHGVGAHTMNHVALTRSSVNWAYEVDQNVADLERITGRTVECLRPPYGDHNAAVDAALASRGLSTIMWTSNPADYTRPGAGVIAARAIGSASPGAVIGLHDGGGDRSQTVAALPTIIEWYRSAGYRFVALCNSGRQPAPIDVSGTESGGYAVWSNGALQPFGNAAPVSGQSWTGYQRSRAVAVNGASQGWVLASNGRLLPFNGAPDVQPNVLWPSGDIARDVALRPDGVSGWILDRSGGLQPFGGAPAVFSSAYWPTGDIARAVVAAPDGLGGYVVDRSGGIHGFGTAPELTGTGFWPGDDVVRGAVLFPSGAGGYVLDMSGGVWPFGFAAPMVSPPPYTPGDTARGLVLNTAGTRGWLLDVFARVTPFGVPGSA